MNLYLKENKNFLRTEIQYQKFIKPILETILKDVEVKDMLVIKSKFLEAKSLYEGIDDLTQSFKGDLRKKLLEIQMSIEVFETILKILLKDLKH